MLRKFGFRGFSSVIALAVIVVVSVGVVGGYCVWRDALTAKKSASMPVSQQKHKDIYDGWKLAKSPRAAFTIRYPSSWTYSEVVGSKDSVEHMVVAGSHFKVAIDSYAGKDTATGGQPMSTCPDCVVQAKMTDFTVPKLGPVELKSATYSLDNGRGNALILEQPDGSYFIGSPTVPNVSTSFRGISMLNSEQAYQAETSADFTNNPDFATAEKILESVAY